MPGSDVTCPECGTAFEDQPNYDGGWCVCQECDVLYIARRRPTGSEPTLEDYHNDNIPGDG